MSDNLVSKDGCSILQSPVTFLAFFSGSSGSLLAAEAWAPLVCADCSEAGCDAPGACCGSVSGITAIAGSFSGGEGLSAPSFADLFEAAPKDAGACCTAVAFPLGIWLTFSSVEPLPRGLNVLLLLSDGAAALLESSFPFAASSSILLIMSLTPILSNTLFIQLGERQSIGSRLSICS